MDEFLVLCCLFSENELSPLLLSFPLFVSLHLDNGYLSSVVMFSSIFSPVLSYFNPHALCTLAVLFFFRFTLLLKHRCHTWKQMQIYRVVRIHFKRQKCLPLTRNRRPSVHFSAQHVQASKCATRILAKGLERRMEQRD